MLSYCEVLVLRPRPPSAPVPMTPPAPTAPTILHGDASCPVPAARPLPRLPLLLLLLRRSRKP